MRTPERKLLHTCHVSRKGLRTSLGDVKFMMIRTNELGNDQHKKPKPLH